MKSRYNYLKNKIRRYRHTSLIAFAGRIVLFVFCGVALGMYSAWYMIEKGSALTTIRHSSWQNWFSSGSIGADPYTLAFMARSGRLPITSSSALYFIAKQDDEGETLNAECDYSLLGKPLDTDWWSLAVYDSDGASIHNKDSRSSVNSSGVMRYANGGYLVNLSEQARAGNWIQLGGDDDLVLILRVYGIHGSKDTRRSNAIEENLPIIKRVACR